MSTDLTTVFSKVAEECLKAVDRSIAGEKFYQGIIRRIDNKEDLSGEFAVSKYDPKTVKKLAKQFGKECHDYAHEGVWHLGDRFVKHLSCKVVSSRSKYGQMPQYTVRYDIRTRHGSVFVNVKTQGWKYKVDVEDQHIPEEFRHDALRNAGTVVGMSVIASS